MEKVAVITDIHGNLPALEAALTRRDPGGQNRPRAAPAESVARTRRRVRGDADPQEIRECADAVLSSFDYARIRSHVASLARRRTRDCLQADHCYELEIAR